jgi:excisionase family DNA binding protein
MKKNSKIHEALTILSVSPDMPINQVAKKIGCSRQNLSSNEIIKAKGYTMGFQDLVGAVECAKELKVRHQWLLEAAESGAIPAVQYGKQWRFNPEAVKKAIEAIAAGK